MKYLEPDELKIGETYLCESYDGEYLILKYSTEWPRGWIRYVIMEMQSVITLINEYKNVKQKLNYAASQLTAFGFKYEDLV